MKNVIEPQKRKEIDNRTAKDSRVFRRNPILEHTNGFYKEYDVKLIGYVCGDFLLSAKRALSILRGGIIEFDRQANKMVFITQKLDLLNKESQGKLLENKLEILKTMKGGESIEKNYFSMAFSLTCALFLDKIYSKMDRDEKEELLNQGLEFIEFLKKIKTPSGLEEHYHLIGIIETHMNIVFKKEILERKFINILYNHTRDIETILCTKRIIYSLSNNGMYVAGKNSELLVFLTENLKLTKKKNEKEIMDQFMYLINYELLDNKKIEYLSIALILSTFDFLNKYNKIIDDYRKNKMTKVALNLSENLKKMGYSDLEEVILSNIDIEKKEKIN